VHEENAMTRYYLRRYRDATRMNHWFVAIMFFAAALSGLAFFHPALFFLSALFGGGPWTRILHPFMGLLMVWASCSCSSPCGARTSGPRRPRVDRQRAEDAQGRQVEHAAGGQVQRGAEAGVLGLRRRACCCCS
jgi:hypothetical protein